MEPAELRRLVVRHRHVAPMLSVLLATTDASVRITDVDGEVILDRQPGDGDRPVLRSSATRSSIDGTPVGWVEGPRPAGAIAAVLTYACAREADKRALAREALDRYRELNLIYDLADEIGATLETDAVARVGDRRGGPAADRRSRVRPPAPRTGRAARRSGRSDDDAEPAVDPGAGILGRDPRRRSARS